jgi:hypothetical protein
VRFVDCGVFNLPPQLRGGGGCEGTVCLCWGPHFHAPPPPPAPHTHTHQPADLPPRKALPSAGRPGSSSYGVGLRPALRVWFQPRLLLLSENIPEHEYLERERGGGGGGGGGAAPAGAMEMRTAAQAHRSFASRPPSQLRGEVQLASVLKAHKQPTSSKYVSWFKQLSTTRCRNRLSTTSRFGCG